MGTSRAIKQQQRERETNILRGIQNIIEEPAQTRAFVNKRVDAFIKKVGGKFPKGKKK